MECDTAEDALTFKAILYGLTNVPVDKQKVMVKGKVVKDEDELTKFGIKNGLTMMLMGTAEDSGLREPAQKIKFIEDMTPAERARAMNERAAVVVPAGLDNLGNTCYMNSVMQCLKRVGELKEALKNLPPAQDIMALQNDPEARMTHVSAQMLA